MLNPLKFDNDEEFNNALEEDGRRFGWKPFWKKPSPEEAVNRNVKAKEGLQKDSESA